jgi:hypothetical protein
MFTSLLEDVEHHHRKRVSEERHRRPGMVFRQPGRSDDGVGPSMLHHHHRAHWVLTLPARTPRTTLMLAYS